MKLQPEVRFTSFYESFSDLIFATMAIFVLLMMVFLTQVGEVATPPPHPTPEPTQPVASDVAVDQTAELRDLEREIMQLERRLREQMQQARSAKESQASDVQSTNKKVEELRDALEPRPIELFILIDGSGSMSESMVALRDALRTIVRVMPEVSPSFHLGIIAYRRDIQNMGIDRSMHFPATPGQGVTRLFELGPDDEAGRTAVLQFTSGIQPVSSAAPVAEAIEHALKVMEEPGTNRTQQTLVVMGDVGPEETIDVSITDANGVFDQIRHWRNQGERRNVISVFNPTGGAEGRAFFEGLANAAEQRENFTDEPDKVLALILRGIIDRSGESD